MGAMASRNRKKIAKYKAAVSLGQKSEGEMLQIISLHNDNSNSKPPPSAHKLLEQNEPSTTKREVDEGRAGDIIITWKDGNTSCLYSDPAVQDKQEEEEKHKEESDF